MGYKIWRKDKKEYSLAFDDVFDTKESVDERIAELHAIYHTQFRFGELSFHPYPEDVKLHKNGALMEETLPTHRPKKHKNQRSRR